MTVSSRQAVDRQVYSHYGLAKSSGKSASYLS